MVSVGGRCCGATSRRPLQRLLVELQPLAKPDHHPPPEGKDIARREAKGFVDVGPQSLAPRPIKYFGAFRFARVPQPKLRSKRQTARSETPPMGLGAARFRSNLHSAQRSSWAQGHGSARLGDRRLHHRCLGRREITQPDRRFKKGAAPTTTIAKPPGHGRTMAPRIFSRGPSAKRPFKKKKKPRRALCHGFGRSTPCFHGRLYLGNTSPLNWGMQVNRSDSPSPLSSVS